MILEILFGLIYLAASALIVWSLTQLKGFLEATLCIADEVCLERFKALARTQMYLALVAIPILVTAGLLGILIVKRHGAVGLAVVILTNLIFIALAMYHKKFEKKARGLAANSNILAQEYREICETWVKKALPDF
jgi:hypothetical protein